MGNQIKSLTPLNQLLYNIDSTKKRKLRIIPEYLLADYYRLLRNGYVHREIKKSVSLKKPSEYYLKNITNIQGHFDKYYKTLPESGAPAPNSPQSVSFQDFILYSRAVRNLANYLNELCSFTVEQSLEIAENDPKFLNTTRNLNYKKFPSTKPRLDLYLKNYYKTHFGDSATQINEFTRLFYAKY